MVEREGGTRTEMLLNIASDPVFLCLVSWMVTQETTITMTKNSKLTMEQL